MKALTAVHNSGHPASDIMSEWRKGAAGIVEAQVPRVIVLDGDERPR